MTVVITTGAQGIHGANLLYRNLFLEGTLTATNEAADGFVENAVSGETWDYWKPTAVPSAMIVDLGTAKNCDGVGISAHTIGSSGATVNAQYSFDNVNWVTIATCTPTDDAVIFMAFPAINARYWRLQLTGAVAVIGVAILGNRLQFAAGVLSGHISMHNSKRSVLLNTTTVSGHHRKNRRIRSGIEGRVDFGLVDTAFGDGVFQEFKDHYNSGEVFFYAGSPLHWPNDTALCWRPEAAADITPSYVEGGALMDLAMEVSAFVDS